MKHRFTEFCVCRLFQRQMTVSVARAGTNRSSGQREASRGTVATPKVRTGSVALSRFARDLLPHHSSIFEVKRPTLRWAVQPTPPGIPV